MEGETKKTVRDHRIGNLQRTRDIINGRAPTPQTVEEVLAAESARLGVQLTVKKEGTE
jgi:hypothetical protein